MPNTRMYCIADSDCEYSRIFQITFIAMLGKLEEAILTAVLAAGHEPTAAQLHEILSPAFKEASLETIDIKLNRLGREGAVARRQAEPTQEHGGKTQYHYKVTAAGERALAEAAMARAALDMMERGKATAIEGPTAAVHPGKLIDEHLRQLEWPVVYAAARFGVTREHVYQILRGKSGISPFMAKALARNDIGGTALDWLVCQAKFDLAQPEKPPTPRRRYRQEPNR